MNWPNSVWPPIVIWLYLSFLDSFGAERLGGSDFFNGCFASVTYLFYFFLRDHFLLRMGMTYDRPEQIKTCPILFLILCLTLLELIL